MPENGASCTPLLGYGSSGGGGSTGGTVIVTGGTGGSGRIVTATAGGGEAVVLAVGGAGVCCSAGTAADVGVAVGRCPAVTGRLARRSRRCVTLFARTACVAFCVAGCRAGAIVLTACCGRAEASDARATWTVLYPAPATAVPKATTATVFSTRSAPNAAPPAATAPPPPPNSPPSEPGSGTVVRTPRPLRLSWSRRRARKSSASTALTETPSTSAISW